MRRSSRPSGSAGGGSSGGRARGRGAELVEPDAGLVAVADAELQHVQVLRQGAARGEGVPDREQLHDHRARGLVVAGVALAARQGLLVAPAGGLLPGPQVFQ